MRLSSLLFLNPFSPEMLLYNADNLCSSSGCVLVLGCCTTNQKMCKFPFFHRRKILLWARSICGNIDLGTLLCLSE